ncbi:ABC transporter ATP-binding protein [Candidatus Bathyarchaeota archaeon]|nr:ABC transporter ATP-binding protein [Candidatus Bathyarchaeota archaeon]
MRLLHRLSKYIFKNWHALSLSVLCMLLSTYLQVYIPRISGAVIKSILERGGLNEILYLVAQSIALTCILGVLTFFQRYLNSYFSQRVVYDVRNDLYKAIQRQSFAFFDRIETGQIMSRATTDIDRIRGFLGFQITALIGSIFLIAGIMMSMFSINLELTLFCLSITPPLIVTFALFGKRIRDIVHKAREQYGILTSILWENVSGVRAIRSIAVEDYEKQKFNGQNYQYYQSMLQAVKLRSIFIPLSALISGSITAFVYWYGGLQVIGGRLTIDQLFVFSAYTAMLTQPISRIGDVWSSYQRMVAAGERIFEIIDAAPDVKEKPNAVEMPPIKGHVVFENVSFGYDNNHPILKDVSFEVKPGETVALVGPTGSGKSTIIRLIPRFYDPTSGRILIDGYDIRDVKIESLRRQIGIVSQEIFLFNATVKENIAFGKPDATMDEIINAAKIAKAYDFIMELPQGFNTIVGEGGVTLSGGQRQRIAIARALLMNPRILILDDSTSSVDVDTEYEIQQALSALIKNRTTFIISQRLSTIRNADKIIVLDNGRIVEEGTHEELIKKRGLYYKIYQSLFEAQKEFLPPKIKEEDMGIMMEGR